MRAPENKLKRALAAGEMQIGLWLNLASPSATEIVGGAGYDWALIDGEHAPYDPTMIQAQLRVLGQFALSPIVRVPIGEDWVIKQVMDLGAQSLLVPMVDTSEGSAAWGRRLPARLVLASAPTILPTPMTRCA